MRTAARLALVLLGTAALAAPALAGPKKSSTELTPTLKLDLGADVTSIEAGEYVYNADGTRLSQLDWRSENVYGINGRLTFRLVPWLAFRLGGWTPLSSDSGMNDYDWVAGYTDSGDWTHWSGHENTDLKGSYTIDAGVNVRVLEQGPFSLGILAGYQQREIKWTAYGGSYVYSGDAFRDQSGVFAPNEAGITYVQSFKTPYLGLSGTFASGPFRLTAEATASPFSAVGDRDTHHMRDLVFKESFDPSWMAAGTLKAEYLFTESLSVFGTASYQKHWEAKGSTTVRDTKGNPVGYFGGEAAGMDNETTSFGLGLSYRM